MTVTVTTTTVMSMVVVVVVMLMAIIILLERRRDAPTLCPPCPLPLHSTPLQPPPLIRTWLAT